MLEKHGLKIDNKNTWKSNWRYKERDRELSVQLCHFNLCQQRFYYFSSFYEMDIICIKQVVHRKLGENGLCFYNKKMERYFLSKLAFIYWLLNISFLFSFIYYSIQLLCGLQTNLKCLFWTFFWELFYISSTCIQITMLRWVHCTWLDRK